MSTSTWLKLMNIGGKFGCHQLPERSFFLKGYQFPVCARCTGVLLGYLLTIPLLIFFKPNILIPTAFALIMFFDWLLQAKGILPSTNPRRLITGFLGGLGLMYFYLKILSLLINLISPF